MHNQPDNTSSQVPDNIEVRPFSAGFALRQARERHGLSVADVSNRLKFAPRQIEALEADDLARLPEIAFVRGFMRSYAKLLQIDPAPLLAALPQAPSQLLAADETAALAIPFPAAYTTRKLNIIWMAAGLLVTIILGLFVWLHDDTPEGTQTAVETLELPLAIEQTEAASTVKGVADTVAVAVVTKQPAASAIPSIVTPQTRAKVAPAQEAISHKDALIHLVFDDESWVEVADKDGKSLLAQLNPRGSEKRINGTPPFSLVIGNASGVRLYYQGKRVDLTPYNKAEVAHLTLE